jgi:alkylation response protein AidB-like acyl-CoA dehydrogenase
MDFRDTPQDAVWRDECRTWLTDNAPRLADIEDGLVPKAKAWQAIKYEAGLVKIPWEPEYGGRKGTPMQQVIFNDEESKARTRLNLFMIGSFGLFGVGLNFIAPTIRNHGTEAQKRDHLIPLLRGEKVWCQLFSEPGAGSDVASLSTMAVRDGDEFVINGQKVWTGGADVSDWGEILCRTNPVAPKHQGITAFVVDMRAPGVTVRPLRQMTGGSDFNEVFFDDVRVSADQVLGDVNNGWHVAVTTLSNEKSSIGSSGAGRAGGGAAFKLAELARERGVLDDPVVRQKIADVWIHSKIGAFLASRTLTAASQDRLPGPEGSVGKLLMAALTTEIAETAMRILGPHGIAGGNRNRAWQRQFLGAPGTHLGGGSDNINKNLIAERVLGLPAEPRTDDVLPWRELLR